MRADESGVRVGRALLDHLERVWREPISSRAARQRATAVSSPAVGSSSATCSS
jgi:hypothetical protein